MTTPNMTLIELVPGTTSGPQYATDIVSNFSTIDAHDHTTGNGVKVPSAGLNINSELDFNNNSPINQRTSKFANLSAAPSAASDYRSLSVVNGELFYLDNSGNQVQLTSGGSVSGPAGDITGLSSPASVTFLTNKFTFRDSANSFAILESADVRIFEDSASAISQYVALQSPSSLASTYTLTMPPALPSATNYLASNASGTLSFVTANSIAEARTRSVSTSASAGGIAQSNSINFTFTSTTAVDVDDVTGNPVSITLTTSGRPVVLALVGDPSFNPSYFSSTWNGTGIAAVGVRLSFLRGASVIKEVSFVASGVTTVNNRIPLPGVVVIQDLSAGTYTWTMQAEVSTSNETGLISRARLVAYEL